MTEQQHIVIVEDEKKLAALLNDYLLNANFKITIFYDGSEVTDWVKVNPVDLILLDIMLPGKDGIEICKEIRQFTSTPIIMTTAKVEQIDRILGLELGADDYVCKPYFPQELVSRVKAVLRRSQQVQEASNSGNKIILNEDANSVAIENNTIKLTRVEFRILAMLLKRPGKICKRESLMEEAYDDYRIVSDRTIDTHIKNIRKKLAPHMGEEEVIRSVYGIGYVVEMTVF